MIDLLRSDGSITINKRLIKSIGLITAVIYSELLSKYYYFEERNMLTDDGYFFCTVKDMKESTSLTDHQQRQAIKKLMDLKLVDIQVRGVPAKRYVKIVFDENIIEKCLQSPTESQFLKNLRTSTKEIQELYNNTNNNTNLNRAPIDDLKKSFVERQEILDLDQPKDIIVSPVESIDSSISANTNKLSSWKARARIEVADIPEKHQKVTAVLIQNGVGKEKAYELSQLYPNERIRNVVWFAIKLHQAGSISYEQKAGIIINVLEDNKEIPIKTRKQRKQESKIRFLEYIEQNPGIAATLFRHDAAKQLGTESEFKDKIDKMFQYCVDNLFS